MPPVGTSGCFALQGKSLKTGLRSRRVSDKYREILEAEWRALCSWAVVQHRPGPQGLKASPVELDRLLVEYLEDLHQRQENPTRGKHAILAVQHQYPRTRRCLTEAWDLLRTWENLQPLSMRTPCPFSVAWALFVMAVQEALVWDPVRARSWFATAIGILCCFYALLRPAEFCSLRRKHVLLPRTGEMLQSSAIVFALERPKNQRYMGKAQVACCSHKVLTRWLRWFLECLGEEDLIVGGGPHAFRFFFGMLIQKAGLQDCKLTPASLRAGGATWLYQNGYEVGRIRMMGRWRSVQSLDHYIQEAAATAVMLRLSPASEALVNGLLSHSHFLRQPPGRPWWELYSRPCRTSASRSHTLPLS